MRRLLPFNRDQPSSTVHVSSLLPPFHWEGVSKLPIVLGIPFSAAGTSWTVPFCLSGPQPKGNEPYKRNEPRNLSLSDHSCNHHSMRSYLSLIIYPFFPPQSLFCIASFCSLPPFLFQTANHFCCTHYFTIRRPDSSYSCCR